MLSEEMDDKEKGRYEWRTFLFIVVLLFPILSVMFVSGYGFFYLGAASVFPRPSGSRLGTRQH